MLQIKVLKMDRQMETNDISLLLIDMEMMKTLHVLLSVLKK